MRDHTGAAPSRQTLHTSEGWLKQSMTVKNGITAENPADIQTSLTAPEAS
ncbi:hypothetical protein NBRC3293_2082 [Gluconobacter oxydans NBRC 3293]|uniref:Uncharacterized protein n=1 Tax=Gluconobacter oxydans NBRC 3293 TaxID=1315969 RepID=A0A829XAX7_GLUOY|nr:hypothetical protein NBRC3293_2082 [Gluconobacter oxydans NBRC 3293]